MLNSDFQRILGNMTAVISDDGTLINNLMRKGRSWDEEMIEMQRHIMDYFVASSYVMNWDGSTDGQNNYITEAQFDILMGKIKKYAA